MKPLLLSLSLVLAATQALASAVTLVDFVNPMNGGFWSPLTDQVRGGRSTAFMELLGDGTAEISGELTLIDNAGFASYRVTPEFVTKWSIDRAKNLDVTAQGDGRVYRVLLKDAYVAAAAADYSWEASLPTGPTMKTTALPLDQFVPVYRGKIITGVPPLDLSQIVQIGIQINDKKAGPYSIRLESIKAK